MFRPFLLLCLFSSLSHVALAREDITSAPLLPIKNKKEATTEQETVIDLIEEQSNENNAPNRLSSKDFTNRVVLQGLNKITARISSLEVIKGEEIAFGNLIIALQNCWRSPSYQLPENKALIKIWEQRPGEKREELFFGWMFSSSPALSGLEHPVYDITVVECLESTVAPPSDIN